MVLLKPLGRLRILYTSIHQCRANLYKFQHLHFTKKKKKTPWCILYLDFCLFVFFLFTIVKKKHINRYIILFFYTKSAQKDQKPTAQQKSNREGYCMNNQTIFFFFYKLKTIFLLNKLKYTNHHILKWPYKITLRSF